MSAVSFFVPGTPSPGGSKRGFAYKGKNDGKVHVAIVDTAGQKVKDWRANVALATHEHIQAPLEGPVWSKFHFLLQRPKSHYKTGKKSNELKEDAPMYHTQTPDSLKLARSTEDSLTGIAWNDDKQVVDMRSSKSWAERGETTGCYIMIATEPIDYTNINTEGFTDSQIALLRIWGILKNENIKQNEEEVNGNEDRLGDTCIPIDRSLVRFVPNAEGLS
jgi:crossover junction endodeoxyribonuclease RusA